MTKDELPGRRHLMRPAGFAAYEARSPEKEATYSFERDEPPAFDAALRERCEAHEEAWAFFQAQPPGHRRVVTHWVTSAKREATQTW